MFEGIKRRWAEARADVISKMVEDILRRYRRMHSADTYLVISAFERVLDDLEDKDVSVSSLNSEEKKELAKFLMKVAQTAGETRGSRLHAETSRIGAEGAALLSFYVELQALPGNQAIGLVKMIEDWRSAAQSDLKVSN